MVSTGRQGETWLRFSAVADLRSLVGTKWHLVSILGFHSVVSYDRSFRRFFPILGSLSVSDVAFCMPACNTMPAASLSCFPCIAGGSNQRMKPGVVIPT